MKSGKYVGPTACGTETAQAQMILNSDNPPREVLFFFEIGTELVCTKDYDFGRTEPNENDNALDSRVPGILVILQPRKLCVS